MADNNKSRILLYGATGYTGRLAAGLAAERRLPVVLGGRNPHKLAQLEAALGLPNICLDIADAGRLAAALSDYAVVLNLAGPYRDTARPIREACIAAGSHYVDITGELDVFAEHAAAHRAAQQAGITLLTGAGFDVVPSDCLAAHVCARVSKPRSLKLYFSGGAGMSRGTMHSGLPMIAGGTPVRRGGELIRLPKPPACRRDFDSRNRYYEASAWGDLETAWHSTGVGDITVYFEKKPPSLLKKALAPLNNYLLTTAPVQWLLHRVIERMPEGPTDRQRESARQVLVAEATGEDGQKFAARLQTPEAYTLTAHTCLEAAHRLAQGEAGGAGFQTPAMLFGADFVLTFDGVQREDLYGGEARSAAPGTDDQQREVVG